MDFEKYGPGLVGKKDEGGKERSAVKSEDAVSRPVVSDNTPRESTPKQVHGNTPKRSGRMKKAGRDVRGESGGDANLRISAGLYHLMKLERARLLLEGSPTANYTEYLEMCIKAFLQKENKELYRKYRDQGLISV